MAVNEAGRLRVLKAALTRDLATSERLTALAVRFAEPDLNHDEVVTTFAVALALHHAYSAMESYFERVAKEVDQSVPDGAHWHQQLLEQMTVPIPQRRPALLDESLLRDLDELRRFRHAVRHSYESELDWDRVKPLLQRLPAIQGRLVAEVDRPFQAFLDQVLERLEAEDALH